MRMDMRMPGCDAAARAARYRAAIEMATWADTRGCVSVIVSEHSASDDGYLPSPIPMASAIAAATTNVPIAIAAALLPLYDPVRLAEDMVVLDHLAQGRAMFVFGVGYRPEEYALHGVDFAARGRIADAKLPLLLDALRTRVTPPPFTPGGPMISWGGSSPVAARRAGRHGVGFISQADKPELQRVYEEACRAAGHPVGLCIIPPADPPLSVFVNDDLDEGWAEVGEALLADARPYYEWNEAAGMVEGTLSLSNAQTVEQLRGLDGSHRVVTVAGAVELIRKHGMLALQPLCGGLDPAVAWRYLRRVTDEVMPALATGPS